MDDFTIRFIIAMSQLAKTDSKRYVETTIAAALAALPKGMHYVGAVNYIADLETLSPEIGDIYTVKYKGAEGADPDGTEYAWGMYSGSYQWIDLGPNINGKADKVSVSVSGDLAALDADGNLTDSGIAKTDVLTRQLVGAPDGIASLDGDGLVPSDQLPPPVTIENGALLIAIQFSAIIENLSLLIATQ